MGVSSPCPQTPPPAAAFSARRPATGSQGQNSKCFLSSALPPGISPQGCFPWAPSHRSCVCCLGRVLAGPVEQGAGILGWVVDPGRSPVWSLLGGYVPPARGKGTLFPGEVLDRGAGPLLYPRCSGSDVCFKESPRRSPPLPVSSPQWSLQPCSSRARWASCSVHCPGEWEAISPAPLLARPDGANVSPQLFPTCRALGVGPRGAAPHGHPWALDIGFPGPRYRKGRAVG